MGIDGIALPSLTDLSSGTFVALIILLLLSDRLVWHTRLKKAEQERDRWEGIALKALGVADKLTVHAEVTNEVLTRLPDPMLHEQPQQGGPPIQSGGES